ncbi:hypothetical protein FYJ84_02070 [Veillonellaceae bacterium WCA-693-APC-5D-A]|uniref:CDP-Glycerol:Poly(Glycerophosphate) glycerophosphotransferase n=1 Tax=Anaerovibrio slackiae TaxID=2652309 RepID=A0A6I2UG80_9FIRM|nr:hypothetical protein [Anaerovibrio slackiae]MSU07776.1 hypothetical protein [Anaerovibrio slackiae]
MLNRQQRDELVASLQSVEELWETAAGIDAVQNNIIIEILRVADDACKEGLSATRCVFYRELFQVLMDILEPQVWQNLSADEQAESKRLGLEVLNCAIDVLQHEKEIKKEIVFLPYKASMWDSLESVWQAAYADKEHCNAYVVPIPYADRKPDMTVAEWHCEADMFPDYVPVLDWQEYTLEKLNAMRPDVIFIHNPYDDCNRVTSVEPQYYSHNLKQCTDKLVYIPYYVCGEMTSSHLCQAPGIVNADYVIVQDENIKAQFEQHYPDGTPPEGKFLALGSPKFDKVLASKKEDFTLPESWQRIVKGKKVVLYNTSLGAALDNSDMVCKKLRYVFDVFKNRQDVALWWRPHPLMEATFRSMRPEHYAEYEQIVAEYKQAGWGIYDDTSELHRAIAYSDCYYGDRSSVVDLYKVTGKSIMIECYWLINKHCSRLPNKSISFLDAFWNDEKIYFYNNNNRCLSSYNFHNGLEEFFAMLSFDESIIRIIEHDLRVYFVAQNVPAVYEYNIYDKKYRCYLRDGHMRHNYYPVKYGDCIFLFDMSVSKKSYCFDLRTKQYSEIEFLHENKLIEYKVLTVSDAYGDMVAIAFDKVNIFLYNLREKRCFFKYKVKGAEIFALSLDASHVWYTTCNEDCLVDLDLLTNNENKINFGGEAKEPYSRLYNTKDFLILLPRYNKNIVVINKNKNVVRQYRITDSDNMPMRSASIMYGGMLVGNNFYIYPYALPYMYVIDLEKETIETKEFFINYQDIKQRWDMPNADNIVYVEEYISFELFIANVKNHEVFRALKSICGKNVYSKCVQGVF